MEKVADALLLFKFDHDVYPDLLSDLVELPNYVEKSKWSPYMQEQGSLQDGWGNAMIYRKKGSGYVLGSCGADGKEGGEGRNGDLFHSP